MRLNPKCTFGILIECSYGGTDKKSYEYQPITPVFTGEYLDLFKFVSDRLRSRGVQVEGFIDSACLLTNEDITELMSAIKQRTLIRDMKEYVSLFGICWGNYGAHRKLSNKEIEERFYQSLEKELSILVDVAKTREIFFQFDF